MDGDKIFIENLIKVLKFHPNYFSATWFNGVTLDNSVKSKNGVIIYKDGNIIRPKHISLGDEDKNVLKVLIKPIILKDTKQIVDSIFKNIK